MMVQYLKNDTKELYNYDYFEKANSTAIGYVDYFSTPAANLFGKYSFASLFLRHHKKARVHLDLGAADGKLVEIFTNQGYRSYGLEISSEAVGIARNKGLDVYQSDLKGFPKKIPKVDIVTAFDLLEHSDAPLRVVKEVYKKLARDGIFVFSTLSVYPKNKDDYWLNNSLEHYAYYDRKALESLLGRVFGKGSYAFKEFTINGISEFWGFAKKGDPKDSFSELHKLDTNITKSFETESAYSVSIFYNQISIFKKSQEIIDFYSEKWDKNKQFYSQYYNYYFSGQYVKAISLYEANMEWLLLNEPIFWQSLQYLYKKIRIIESKQGKTEAALINEAKTEALRVEKNKLVSINFKLNNSIYQLRKQPIIGPVIKSAHLKAVVFEDIRLNRARAIRRKLYGNVIGNQVYKKHLPLLSVVIPFYNKSAHLKAVVFEDIRLNRARAIRRKLYGYIIGNFILHFRDAYATKKMRYLEIGNQVYKKHLPLLSVVIPFYNKSDTISDTLRSLEDQTYNGFEVIIVNDGSEELLSEDIYKKQLGYNSKITVIVQKNQGVACARNTGIKKSRGKYILCLDADDIIKSTYIEKCLAVLEADPGVDIVTTGIKAFGVSSWTHIHQKYNQDKLLDVNMLCTASIFRKTAWQQTGGYKSGIGYEDWELWIAMAELGFWARSIPEELFLYRTSENSRYINDSKKHKQNLRVIRSMHLQYRKKIRKIYRSRRYTISVIKPKTAFLNFSAKNYSLDKIKPNIIIFIPWMAFGGAETLILNFTKELIKIYNITYITGLKSDNVWESKFEKISKRIYHLPNLFDDPVLYLEFVSNYIKIHNVKIIHILHTDFVYDMLEILKQRHPKTKVILTMFNSRVGHFSKIKNYEKYIDILTSDNHPVSEDFKMLGVASKKTRIIPNGIDSALTFNPELFNREAIRNKLNINKKDLVVFFIGRLSEEKNPDIFVNVAKFFSGEKEYENIRFFIVGDGPMKQQIEKSIKQLKNTEYLGYRSDIAQLLSASDVFVLPSSIEGFPLSILEAMAVGSVCIASDVGAVSDVIENNVEGFVVKSGSEEETIKAIKILQAEPSKLLSMQKKSRKTVVEKYSNKILGKNYKKLYKDVINNG